MIRICTFYNYSKAREREAMLNVHRAMKDPAFDDRIFEEDLCQELELVGFGEARVKRDGPNYHVTYDGRPFMTWSSADLTATAIASAPTKKSAQGEPMTLMAAAREYGYNHTSLRSYATQGVLATTGTGRNRRVTHESMKALCAIKAKNRFDPRRTEGLKATLRRQRDRRRTEHVPVAPVRRGQRSPFSPIRVFSPRTDPMFPERHPAVRSVVHVASPRRPLFAVDGLGRARGPTPGGDRAPPRT